MAKRIVTTFRKSRTTAKNKVERPGSTNKVTSIKFLGRSRTGLFRWEVTFKKVLFGRRKRR